MKISFWIPAIVFLHAAKIAFSNSVQVGTVLFTTTDLVRRCWSEDDKSVLRARFIMQDLLPDPDCIDFSNPKAAVVLLDYFLACYEIINKCCYGKVQNLMNVAFSDALGGYLKAYVLPSTKRSYYAGQIKYNEAEQIFKLYNNIKKFLKTNGKGWAEPQKLSYRNLHVSPAVITGGSYEACKQLRIIEKNEKLHRIDPHYSYGSHELRNINRCRKSKKASLKTTKNVQCYKKFNDSFAPKLLRKNGKGKGVSHKIKKLNYDKGNNLSNCEELSQKSVVEASTNETVEHPENSVISETKKNKRNSHHDFFSKRVVVPLPMLDDNQNPHSIAVPLKNQPFRNLHSASSAFILEDYYIAVIKCFIAAGNTRSDIKNFNIEFRSWLVSQVLPHLNDEKWYPGFGGVLRIIETIKKFGIEPGFSEPSLHDPSYVFGKGVAFEVGYGKGGKDLPRNIIQGTALNTKRHVISTILVVSLLWIFLFCACAFYYQATRGRCLLTDKYSEGNCSKQSKCRNFPLPNKNTCINFQFLVKFFKKSKQKDFRESNASKACWYVRKLIDKNVFKNQSENKEDKNEDKIPKKKNFDLKLTDELKGQGDFRSLKREEFLTPILPQWPSESLFVKKKIKFASAGDAKLAYSPEDFNKDTTVLWQKPSKIAKDQDKQSSSSRTTCMSCTTSYSTSTEDSKSDNRKRDIFTSYSESYWQSSTSCSNSLPQSKVRKILSWTTMECFEDKKAKRNPFLKSVILASTEESECDDEASTSCESDY